MNSVSSMYFFWDMYSIGGNNTTFDGAEPLMHLSGGGSYTGLWYEPAYSGWGISLEYKDNPQGIDTVATAFYYDGTEPVWAQGAVDGTPTGNKLIELTQYTGIGLCPECVGPAGTDVPVAGGHPVAFPGWRGGVDRCPKSLGQSLAAGIHRPARGDRADDWAIRSSVKVTRRVDSCSSQLFATIFLGIAL